MPLDTAQGRYIRQERFRGIGSEGQALIGKGRVVLIGCGALGTANAEILTRAGVGFLRLVDRDVVELSNLQRQNLFTEDDARRSAPKAVAAQHYLKRVNSEVEIEGLIRDATPDNIEELCADAHLVVDASDNFETRYLINDFSVKHGKPWIYGACIGSFGVVFPFVPGRTPCLQCLLESPPDVGAAPTCETEGILASVVHVVAARQTVQVLRLLTGQPTSSHILQVDVWTDTWRTVPAEHLRTDACACCGQRRFRFLEGPAVSQSTTLCGRNAVQISPAHSLTVDFHSLATRLRETGEVEFNSYMMRVRLPECEIVLFPDGRSIIKGVDDPVKAKALFAKYVGV
jgi:adenylyltransferase/sulfurtransferase